VLASIAVEEPTTPVDPPAREPMVRTPVLLGKSELVAHRITRIDGIVYAGRDAGLELHLPFEGVSRRHAAFERTAAGTVIVRDLGSTNGTRVDGNAIDAYTLVGGESIELGPIELQFVQLTAAELERHETVARARAIVDRLSPREREVALLVAEGLRSQEIATRLHITLRTVNTHLEHIYERLGVRSRMLLGRLLHDALS
jgi:DNA-binding CsgD family transcriptional regulator